MLELIRGDQGLRAAVQEAGQILWDAVQRNRSVLVVGNGGSAADAQHLAGELVVRHR